MTGDLAYVQLAHADPAHTRRLVAAVAPSPVVLHCDARTDDATYAAMIEPPTVVPVPRRPTPWASAEAAFAGLDAIRTALRLPGWEHLIVLQGSDYPLRGNDDLATEIGRHRGRTVTASRPLPRPEWRGGGFGRLRYRHWVLGKRMLRLPVPRRLPAGLVPAGGSVNMVLAREHAALVVVLADRRPELARFWRRSWGADETFVQTLLHTALCEAGRTDEIDTASLWYTDWSGGGKSPAWLTEDHLERLRSAATSDPPALFARKFATGRSGHLLDQIDRELRSSTLTTEAPV